MTSDVQDVASAREAQPEIAGARPSTPLPPGQRAVEGFPRFGTHFHRPPPAIPADPAIAIGGLVTEPFTIPLARLAEFPRRELVADFHCVAGWSAVGLRWEGVPFEAFFRTVVEASVPPGADITHIVFGGLDGFEAAVTVEDALGEDVLIADRLNGRPLDGDHGAPARLVSPGHYGYVNTKHLCRIELHAGQPPDDLGAATSFARWGLRSPFVRRHPRARVWHEERHPLLPTRWVRPLYRLLTPPIMFLCARGSQGDEGPRT